MNFQLDSTLVKAESRTQHRLAASAAYLALASAIVASFVRLWSLRSWREFADESINITGGWLINRGYRLYDTLFEPHMPLAHLVAQITDALIPGEGFAKFRLAVWLFYAVAGLSFFYSPLPVQRVQKALGASLFLALITILAPAWWGEMLLSENIYACAVVVFFNLYLLPRIFSPALTIRPVFLFSAGAAMAVWLSAALVTVYAFIVTALLITALARTGSPIRSDLRYLLAGFGAVTIAQLCWLVAFGSLRGFFEQAITFNMRVYSRYLLEMLGHPGGSFLHVMRDALTSTMNNALGFRYSGMDSLAVVLLTSSAALLASTLSERRGARGGVLWALGLIVLVVSFRARASEFHGAPFYLSILALVSWLIILVAVRDKHRLTYSVAAVVGLMAASTVIGVRAIQFRSGLVVSTARDPGVESAIRYVRAHTRSNERVAAFPMLPVFYYETQRLPATGTIFYLPWNARWEQEFGKRNTCAELIAARPRFILVNRRSVWGHSFTDYARCIHVFIRDNYTQMHQQRHPMLYQLVLPAGNNSHGAFQSDPNEAS